MDITEYRNTMRKGDAIFLVGGLIFTMNLLALIVYPLSMIALPAGIIIMGFGAQIQYAANESLKHEILAAISASNSGVGGPARMLGMDVPLPSGQDDAPPKVQSPESESKVIGP